MPLIAVLVLAASANAGVVSRPAASPILVAPISSPAAIGAGLGEAPLAPSLLPAALTPRLSAPAISAPEPAHSGVSASVLDLDGNAFGPGMPTKIILFKKGGSEELPVSTYDFARIEKKIGADFAYAGENLKDWELRGDASFREFFGPRFAEDLRWAIDNLPEQQWQGPSWEALVRALSDARRAGRFYAITARQHSSEQLLDGFRVLQEKGYIRFLPSVSNLHGVGGSRRTAERKAELMALILDEIEATPPSPDGARPAAGFSDDTWANHEKMRDALLAAIRANPARWTRVKIVLFFTGVGGERPPEAIVLLPDATTRPYVPGEPR